MTKTFKTILILVAVAVVTSAPLQAARVNTVYLSYQDGHTVARVDIEGTIRFTHQTEIAKDGKPFRVILDILSATHNLGTKNFLDLPASSVLHLRTSQFQVKPEKVVRLVFDMKGETSYRVESENASVTLFFADNSGQPFTAWSSAEAVAGLNGVKAEKPKAAPMAHKPKIEPAPAVTVAEKNASIEKDRQASLAPSKQVAKPASKKTPARRKSTTKIAKGDKPYGPAYVAPADPPVKPEPKQVMARQNEQPGGSMDQSTVRKTTAARKEKPVVATAPAPKKQQPKAAPKKAETKAKTVATTDKKKQDTDKSRSTARFRRNAERKIKGTVVAEFPKRLVIKYKSRGKRDPFETLINETKIVNNPIEARVPNVEGLRLVGVIEGADGANSALCEDKDDYGYILKAGDKVQKGYVLRVASDRVYFQIFEYGWSRTVALNLQDY